MSNSELMNSDGIIADNYLGKEYIYLRRPFSSDSINLTVGTASQAPIHIPFVDVIRKTNAFTFSNNPSEQTYIHVNKSGYYRISYNINIIKDAGYPALTGNIYHLIAYTTDIDYTVEGSYSPISGDYAQMEEDDTEIVCQWTSTEQLNEGMTIRIAVGAVGTPPGQFNIYRSLGNYPNGKTPPRVASEIFIDKV